MIRKEWRRVFGTRTMLLMILLFLVVQSILLVYSEGKSRDYSADAYKEAWNEVEALLAVEEPEAVLERLDRHIEKLDFLEYFVEIGAGAFYEQVAGWLGAEAQADLYAFLEEEYPSVDSSMVLQQYRAGVMVRHSERPSVEKQLYKDISTELLNVASYPEYRETLVSDAERMLRLPIFVKPGTFGYRNIEATLEAYQVLPEITVRPVPAKGAATLFQGSVPGVLMLFFLLYLCIPLYLSEREEGTVRITRTCVKGRKTLARTKLVVFFLGTFVMQLLLFCVRFVVLDVMYGFPDLSLSIQSVSGFQGCVLPITIGQYFLLNFMLRYVVLCLCAVCMAVFCSLCSSTKKAYAGILAFFLLHVILYDTVSANASYGALHFLNIWGILRFDAIGSYLNLNLFGMPVACLPAVMVFIGVGLVTLTFIAVRAFCKKPVNGHRREKSRKVRGVIPQTTSVFLHEGRKLFFDQRVLLILLVVLVVQGFRYKDREASYSMDEYYYRYYMEMLSGPLTPEKENFLEKEMLRFQELHKMDNTNINVQKALNAEAGFQRAYSRYLHLTRTKNGEFFYDTGYRYLLAGDTYEADMLLMVTAVVLFTLTAAGVFCGDTENGMLQLLTTTRNGKKGIGARLIWGSVLAVCIWLLVYLPDLICTLKQYGIQGLSAPAQSIALLADVEHLLLKEYLGLLYMTRLLSLLVLSGVVYLLAYFTKSTAVTVFGTLTIFTVPALLLLLNEKMTGIVFPYAPFSGNMLRRYPGIIGGALVLLYAAFAFFSYKFMVKRRKFTFSLFTNEEE